VDVFGSGVDIRSKGGFVVGAGSTIGGKSYDIDKNLPIVAAPTWMVEKCGIAKSVTSKKTEVFIHPALATEEAILYLDSAPRAIEGQGGDETAFKVACGVRGKGVDAEECLQLMLNNWNDYCSPPWDDNELAVKVANAYAHAQNAQGSEAITADLTPIVMDVGKKPATLKKSEEVDPELLAMLEELNKEYAVITHTNPCILQEHIDRSGDERVEFLSERAFNLAVRNRTLYGKEVARTWLSWSGRRQYKGVAFQPDDSLPPDYLNLWRGFAVKPAATASHPMVERWKEHALNNICNGDETLYTWLVAWFANLVQRPWDKQSQPVALVFKGGKGVGKNALVERVSHLFERGQAITTSDGRYLTGNFNGHLEKCMMLVLDEAFWSGDKRAEGRIKDLITGENHTIERKGLEMYTCPNYTRLCIIGNEDWLAPASADERRFAVFNVGEGRKQDTKYFEELRKGLDDEGGNAFLLRFLLDVDVSQVNLKVPPVTEGLDEQKLESLTPVQAWWHECLSEGRIVGAGTSLEWGDEVPTVVLSAAVSSYYRMQGVRNRVPTLRNIMKELKRMGADPVEKRLGRSRADTLGCSYARVFEGLSECRHAFSEWLKVPFSWTE
jgi:hypothetical protein